MLLLVGTLMAAWTWKMWPDVIIDFGTELYIAWRIASGDTLYADIAYDSGPLSPHVNGLLFAAFGVGLNTLVYANLAVLAGTVWLLYLGLRETSDRLAATTGCVVFLAVFAFGQYVLCANYNFVCPYRHELTHGMLLSLGALLLQFRYVVSERRAWLAAAGLALGLVFLTKAEMFVAAAGAAVAGVACRAAGPARRRQRLVADAALIVATATVPPLIAWGLLARSLPPAQAALAVAGSWPLSLSASVGSSPFYARSLGVEHWPANVATMGTWLLWYAAIVGPAVVLALISRRWGRWGWSLPTMPAIIVIAIATLRWRQIAWDELARPLPIILLVLSAATVAELRGSRPGDSTASTLVLRMMLLIFSLGLLGKIMFAARIEHYGFVLAAPATVIVCVALLHWLPAWFGLLGEARAGFQVFALFMLALFIAAHVSQTHFWRTMKRRQVGSGRDAFVADAPRGDVVEQAVGFLRSRLREDETLAVYPDGAMLGYLARRRNPSPYVHILPHEVSHYGESTMLSALRAFPPDYVALVHKDTSSWGVPYFGQDYAERVYDWIAANYRPVARGGALPFGPHNRFGVLVLARIPSTAAP